MGILGTDYAFRSGHVIFLLLVTSSVMLGFSYLNEMNQRIQLQEKMERQTQHLVAERSVIQRKASQLQAQIENRDKEMKRLQDTQAFQSEQQNSICEEERNDLLETISSKDDTILNTQNEYNSLKERFEHLRSVMEQFERNQSRLIEKFSTQSTQCMNVINMLSTLCNKRNNVIEKTATVTKQNDIFTERAIKQSSTSVNATVSSLLASPRQYFYQTEVKKSIEVSGTRPPTKSTIPDSDNDKLSKQKAMQELQKKFSELKDDEDEIMNLENIQYLKENVPKSTSEEEDLHKNVTIEETQLTTQELSTEQQTKSRENRPAQKASESVNLNETKINKVDTQKPMLPPKNKNLQLTNQNTKTEDRDIFIKEDLTNTSKEDVPIGEDNKKSDDKVTSVKEMVEAQKKPEKLILGKVKTLESYKENEESQDENNNEDLETDFEVNDDEISDIML